MTDTPPNADEALIASAKECHTGNSTNKLFWMIQKLIIALRERGAEAASLLSRAERDRLSARRWRYMRAHCPYLDIEIEIDAEIDAEIAALTPDQLAALDTDTRQEKWK